MAPKFKFTHGGVKAPQGGGNIKQIGTINASGADGLEKLAELLNRSQSEIAAKVNQVLTNPLLNGRLIPGVVLLAANNPTNVEHGLGRQPLGWIVIDSHNNAVTWASDDSNPKKKNLVMELNTSADNTIDLWVF